MKEFAKYLARRYSAVNAEDVDAVSNNQHHHVDNVLATGEKRKSLRARRSVNASGILNSFFNERSSTKSARSPKCAFLMLSLGILAICGAVLIKIFHPYDLIFKWKLTMSDGGEIFNLWAKPPVDLYLKVYLFNITNAAAFMEGREKMHVEQVGPYVYKEIMTHENITFNENNTMSTNPSHPLVWQEHLSEGRSEDDEVVMLNIAMLAISHLTADKPFFIRMALNSLFMSQDSKPIVRMTAKEFMFGYATTLTSLGNTFLPGWIYFDKVGLVDRMMDFNNDFETFHTGVPDPRFSGLYATYRGSPNLRQWDGEHCSNIENASDGVKFPSFIKPNDTIKFFRKSMCRPVTLHRADDELINKGSLSGYRYIFEDNLLDNGRVNENNKCFCRKGYCQPVGLVDVTDCYYGFPISLSFPHFMDGDPRLQTDITGLEPDKEKHSSEFIIEPESGLPLSLSVKVQINMHFRDMSAYGRVKRFSHLTVPMLWFEITLPELPDSLDSRFNFYLNILPYIEPLGFWSGIVLGLALLVYAVTRATMRLTTLSKKGQTLEVNYARANILQVAANGVYNPCEMKLLHANEKNNMILRNDGHESDDLYAELQTPINQNQQQQQSSKIKQRSSFALELEPAISNTDTSSSSSSDEGNESDTATLTLSRNSTPSCSDDGETNNDSLISKSFNSDDDDDDDGEQNIGISLSSCRSSMKDSHGSVPGQH
ncbi:scavenger receptor class B member 1 isoform X1 [Musca domestica]|uniref:Scavenger receptor class B member 1 isoform X1 n=1 Tax=Musca domestica TaxID=7370 RepID=A0A9J7CRL4_MUSDO|nr:scavenger receptor class B member 1 isoform X1 [Musca domestica]